MHLVDTSVWIHALRPTGNATIRSLLKPLIISGDTAITEWILLELMSGLRAGESADVLLKWFSPIPRISFEPAWWQAAWDTAARLRKNGISPSAADCFIATVAVRHPLTLIHCDADFEDLKRHSDLQTLDWTAQLGKARRNP